MHDMVAALVAPRIVDNVPEPGEIWSAPAQPEIRQDQANQLVAEQIIDNGYGCDLSQFSPTSAPVSPQRSSSGEMPGTEELLSWYMTHYTPAPSNQSRSVF